jgi:hypothetical protein
MLRRWRRDSFPSRFGWGRRAAFGDFARTAGFVAQLADGGAGLEKTAMLLACRQPERVERLIVVDMAPKAYASAEHRAEFAAMGRLRCE